MTRRPPRPRPGVAALPQYSSGLAVTRPDGSPGHRLASNEAPGPPAATVQQAIARAAATAHRYPPGGHALISRLAGRLGIPTDSIAVGGGSLALLQQLMAAFAGPGDQVLFGWPSYEAYPILAGITGATPVRVPLTAERIDLGRLAGKVTERTRLILLANPNNPTGTVVDASEVARFLTAVPSDCLVVLDEAYREFARGPRLPDGLALASERPDVMMLRTFSKAYALAGIRVGYGVAHPEVIGAIRRVALPFTLTAMAEAAALAAMDDEPSLHRRVRAITAERARVYAALISHQFTTPEPHGNFIWLPLGTQAGPFAGHCAALGVSVRCFAGSGVRVTIGTSDDNDAFLAAATAWQLTPTGAPS